MRFKILIIVLITAVGGWCAWWWIAASAQERALLDWMSARRADGWLASAEIGVSGFPNRVDANMSNITLSDPMAGWVWSAPHLTLYQLAYDPEKAIITWPQTQTLKTPSLDGVLKTELMRASVGTSGGTFDRASLEINQASFTDTSGWAVSVNEWIQHIRRAPDGGPNYQFRIDANGLRPPVELVANLDPSGVLPPLAQTFIAEGEVELASEVTPAGIPPILNLALKDAQLGWGPLQVTMAGNLAPDTRGFLGGDLTITTPNWQAVVDATETGGAIDQNVAQALRLSLGLVALLDGNPNSLKTTLHFTDGLTYVGPVPIGPAPRVAD
ncbi:MAG: DUF2125 domain-containing protein [Pikeienuella sp.]